jgi:hypothetical protein
MLVDSSSTGSSWLLSGVLGCWLDHHGLRAEEGADDVLAALADGAEDGDRISHEDGVDNILLELLDVLTLDGRLDGVFVVFARDAAELEVSIVIVHVLMLIKKVLKPFL